MAYVIEYRGPDGKTLRNVLHEEHFVAQHLHSLIKRGGVILALWRLQDPCVRCNGPRVDGVLPLQRVADPTADQVPYPPL